MTATRTDVYLATLPSRLEALPVYEPSPATRPAACAKCGGHSLIALPLIDETSVAMGTATHEGRHVSGPVWVWCCRVCGWEGPLFLRPSEVQTAGEGPELGACPRGHLYTPENTYTFEQKGKSCYACRTCRAQAQVASRGRKAARNG